MFERGSVLALMLLSGAACGAEALQDPTRPSTYAGAAAEQARAAQSLALTAIRLMPAGRSAVIDGRTVRVGDSVGNARVTAIDATGVRLRRGSEDIALQLLPLKVKQAHGATAP